MIKPQSAVVVNGGKSDSQHSCPNRTEASQDTSLHAAAHKESIFPTLGFHRVKYRAGSSVSFRPTILATMAVLLSLVLMLAVSPRASADPSWGSNPGGWSGSGTVYLPGGEQIGTPDSPDESGCSGCVWKAVPHCLGGIIHPCEAVPPFLPCPKNEVRYLIYFGRSGGALNPQGVECIGPGSRPVSSVEVDTRVQDRVKQIAPKLSFGFQPATRPVTQLPVIFRTGQVNKVARTDSIVGFSVRMRANVSRVWQWGDSSSRKTTERGGRWPNKKLSHVYRTAGKKRVRVTALWRAEYSVSGGRWIQVPGAPVSQSTSLVVPVLEARAQLVG